MGSSRVCVKGQIVSERSDNDIHTQTGTETDSSAWHNSLEKVLDAQVPHTPSGPKIPIWKHLCRIEEMQSSSLFVMVVSSTFTF